MVSEGQKLYLEYKYKEALSKLEKEKAEGIDKIINAFFIDSLLGRLRFRGQCGVLRSLLSMYMSDRDRYMNYIRAVAEVLLKSKNIGVRSIASIFLDMESLANHDAEPYIIASEELEGDDRGRFIFDFALFFYSKGAFLQAINLFKTSREFLSKGSYEYSLSLMNEGACRIRLAEIGIDEVNNLIKAIELISSSREYLFGDSLSLALINESTARNMLAEKGIDSEENLKKSLELCREAKDIIPEDTLEYAAICVNEAIANYNLGKLDRALEELKYAEKIFKKHKQKQGLLKVYKGFGDVFYKKNENEKAHEYYKKAVGIIDELLLTEVRAHELGKSSYDFTLKTYAMLLKTSKPQDLDKYINALQNKKFIEMLVEELKDNNKIVEELKKRLKEIEK